MKKKDLENLHTKTADELITEVNKVTEEIAKLQIDQKMGGKVKNLNELRQRMKNRARMLTIITEKKKGEALKAE